MLGELKAVLTHENNVPSWGTNYQRVSNLQQKRLIATPVNVLLDWMWYGRVTSDLTCEQEKAVYHNILRWWGLVNTCTEVYQDLRIYANALDAWNEKVPEWATRLTNIVADYIGVPTEEVASKVAEYMREYRWATESQERQLAQVSRTVRRMEDWWNHIPAGTSYHITCGMYHAAGECPGERVR
jgi:hypothetical protein